MDIDEEEEEDTPVFQWPQKETVGSFLLFL